MKIAVILASNIANTGMYSVDLAGFRLFESFDQTVDYFMAGAGGAYGVFKYGQLPVHHLSHPEMLRDYDTVVYWGDFTTNPQYGMDDFFLLRERHDGADTRSKAFGVWLDLLMLRRIEKGGMRIFSFGQNFQSLPVAAKRMDLTVIAPLYARFDAFLPRDPVSCDKLAATFPGIAGDRIMAGTDCAFLLDGAVRNARPDGARDIGAFLFRSNIQNPRVLGEALQADGHRVTDIRRWLGAPTNALHTHFRDKCDQIRSFGCVITDTYHLAVNAIREGVTPIVLGRTDREQLSTVSDYKKRVLLHDLGAEDLHVEVPGDMLDDATIESITSKVAAILDRSEPHPIHAEARRRADSMRTRIEELLLA